MIDVVRDENLKRYMRQYVIPEFGARGQSALEKSSVLIVGAGGLGSPVVAYLAGAGVGRIGIVDHDTIALSNLNRQVIYQTAAVGSSKAEAARDFALALNPSIEVLAFSEAISFGNCLDLVQSFDIVVDGTDNIDTRRTVATAALRSCTTLVCGAVNQLEGHVAVLPPCGVGVPTGFDVLFPAHLNNNTPSCEASGVIGAVAGVIGSLMAMETIKVLSGLGTPIEGRVTRYFAATGRFEEHVLSSGPQLRVLVGG